MASRVFRSWTETQWHMLQKNSLIVDDLLTLLQYVIKPSCAYINVG